MNLADFARLFALGVTALSIVAAVASLVLTRGARARVRRRFNERADVAADRNEASRSSRLPIVRSRVQEEPADQRDSEGDELTDFGDPLIEAAIIGQRIASSTRQLVVESALPVVLLIAWAAVLVKLLTSGYVYTLY